jgi:hypothetical protein
VGLQAQPSMLGLDSIFLKEKNTNDMSSTSLEFDHYSGARKIRTMPLLIKKKKLDF